MRRITTRGGLTTESTKSTEAKAFGGPVLVGGMGATSECNSVAGGALGVAGCGDGSFAIVAEAGRPRAVLDDDKGVGESSLGFSKTKEFAKGGARSGEAGVAREAFDRGKQAAGAYQGALLIQSSTMPREVRVEYPGAMYHPPSPKATAGQAS
jgi:hypothetical protein